MLENSAFNMEKLENHEQIELVYEHSYNDITVCFNTSHINSELMNFVQGNCSETLHIYNIAGGNEKTNVSFEF